MKNEINIDEIIKETGYTEKKKQYVIKPECDATEAQARRTLLEELKKMIARKRIEFRVEISKNAKTIPDETNEMYCDLDDDFAKFIQGIDTMIVIEKGNVLKGE